MYMITKTSLKTKQISKSRIKHVEFVTDAPNRHSKQD